MFCNSTCDYRRYVQGPTLCKQTHVHIIFVDFCKKLLYFHFFFFSYICVINRREEQASVGPLADPAPYVLFFFPPFFTLQTTFHRMYNRKIFKKTKKKSLTQAEFFCYQLIALFILFSSFFFYKDL